MSSKKILSDLVKKTIDPICNDPSAHTDVFTKLLGPDWLCGGLIHVYLGFLDSCPYYRHTSLCQRAACIVEWCANQSTLPNEHVVFSKQNL